MTDERTPGHRSDEVDAVLLHTPRSWSTWVLLLLGPVTWATHFMGVYLAVEAWCAAGTTSVPTWLGATAPVAVTLVATAVAVLVLLVAIAFTAVRLRQARELAARDEHVAADTPDPSTVVADEQLVRDRQLLKVGLLLGPLSLVTVLAVGLTALWVPTC